MKKIYLTLNFVLQTFLLFSQNSKTISIKVGSVIPLYKINSNIETNYIKKTGIGIGVSYNITRKKLYAGFVLEFEGNKQEHSFSHLDTFDSGIPSDFEMIWKQSYTNYQVGLLLGYQIASYKNYNLLSIINPQISFYSLDMLSTGYKNFYYINDRPFLLSYDDPSKYPSSIYKYNISCNPKFQLELNKSFHRVLLGLGASYTYYLKKFPVITNTLIIDSYDKRVLYKNYNIYFKPQTINAFLKIGYNFNCKKRR